MMPLRRNKATPIWFQFAFLNYKSSSLGAETSVPTSGEGQGREISSAPANNALW